MTEVVDRYPKAQRTFPVAVERQREIMQTKRKRKIGKWNLGEGGKRNGL